MTLPFIILAVLTIAGAAAAMGMRNLVHCVLALTLAFTGLSGLYLLLGTQFVGFAQILVYVGAVSILIIFTIMMTQIVARDITPVQPFSWIVGVVLAVVAFAALAWAIVSDSFLLQTKASQPEIDVRQIGNALMERFILPLEIVGLLLTVAFIGAVVIAMNDAGETE